MKYRSAFRSGGIVFSATLAGLILSTRTAAADVTLMDADGWTVFTNGRVQAFLNYNNGDGFPVDQIDGNGNPVGLFGGGLEPGDAVPEGRTATDPGKVEELRIRTGFVGNVLGVGIRRQIDEQTDVLGYTAVTVYIDSTDRRKYAPVIPDWRESWFRVSSSWGSFSAGRMLTLFSRGATEITYLYGFKYGLGWPGSVSIGNGTTAGHVGFGVLGNGFGAGMTYATPVLQGFQLTAGVYDANTLVGSGIWERSRWPRPEAEATYEMKLGNMGMFKLFANGAWQKVYRNDNVEGDATIYGVGYGGRVEVGPVRLGLAAHYGVGIGVDFALQPSAALWHPQHADPENDLRTVDGYYAQLQVAPTKTFDLSAGAGVTRVKLLDTDTNDVRDDDMNPATPSVDDDPIPGVPDSIGEVPVKQQLGFSAGATFHLTENLHVALEYFRAIFQWYKPTPAAAGTQNPEQKFHVVNTGVTYDW